MKYKVLVREFSSAEPSQEFEIFDLEAKDEYEAWDIVESNINSTNSQSWLLTIDEFVALCNLINDNK